ncbi:MAG: hypothetical protein Q9220_003378 [cf. Caloplaca sp. 1 TL-2023]
MRLCTNRIDTFGPLSTHYPHILTSCFIDTILTPLATWLYFLILLILLFFSRASPSPTPSTITAPADHRHDDEKRPNSFGGSKKKKKLHRFLIILYTLLLIAQILMCVLELTRLSIAQLGIGLLPFTIVAIICAGALRLAPSFVQTRVRGWEGANVALWVMLVVVSVVKVVEEARELARKGDFGRDKGVQGRYKVEDQITDVGVMVGVYIALGVLEVALLWKR